ncbi:MAG: thioredoxin [Cyclobacteriaceae bacterium]
MKKNEKSMQKSSQPGFWEKTRPVQIAVLVLIAAMGTIFIFNRPINAENEAYMPERASAMSVSDADSKIVKLTDASFENGISEGVVLVDFWATWCAPCRIQNPILEDVANEIGEKATIAKLDVDDNPRTPSSLQVQNIPTLIIFKDGQAVQKFIGVQQKETLMAAIESHI